MKSRESPAVVSRRRGSLRPSALLVLLVVATAALRLWAAAPNPGPKRFWDERYLVANTARVLSDGWAAPQNVYYPGLGHAPAALLLRFGDLVGVLDLEEAVVSRRQLDATGYRVARGVSVAWALAGVVFVFLLGRRLVPGRGEWAGLTAATLAAFVPWFLRQSILYKPDIALCALIAGSLWACLRLEERATRGNWLLFFLLPSLAFCAKWNAAPLLVPMVWVLWRRWRSTGTHRERASWATPVAALAVGVTTLVVLNPTLVTEPSSFQRDLSKTATHYEGRAAKAEASNWQMPVHAVTSMLSDDYLGPLWGTLGWGGLLLLCWGAADRTRGWRLLALWVATYVAVYSVATAYPSPHNWMPLLPALCLTAVGAVARVAARVRRRSFALLLVVVAGCGLLERALPTLALAHREAVPTSSQVAERLLAARLGEDFAGRFVLSDVPLHDRLRGFATQSRTLDPRKRRLLVVSPKEALGTELPDAAVWHPETIGGRCTEERARELLGPVPVAGAVETVRPGLLRARGETLCVAATSWQREGAPGADEAQPTPGPEIALSVDLVHRGSFERSLPVGWRGPDGALLTTTPCVPLRRRADRVFCRTARVALPIGAEPEMPEVEVRRVDLVRWASGPEAAPVTGGARAPRL